MSIAPQQKPSLGSLASRSVVNNKAEIMSFKLAVAPPLRSPSLTAWANCVGYPKRSLHPPVSDDAN